MENDAKVRVMLKENYDRMISGKLSEDEMLEMAITLSKSGTIHRVSEDITCFLWGDFLEDVLIMPFDALTEFIGTPTHTVMATIMYAWNHSQKVRDYSPLIETLSKGMEGAVRCTFHGQGYEYEEVLLRNIGIYKAAGADEFLQKYGYLNEKFTKEYVNIRGYWEARYIEQ